MVLGQERLVSFLHFWHFIQQLLGLLDELGNLDLIALVLLTVTRIDLVVVLRIQDLEMSLLDQDRDLFKPVEAVLGVELVDAVDDLGEVRVQVLADDGAARLHLPQLPFQFV